MSLNTAQIVRRFCSRLWFTVLLLAATATVGNAHSVSVGYVVSGPGSITVYYGAYHGLTAAEGLVSLVGPVTIVKAAGNVVGTKPAGLVDGTNNFFAGACNGGSLSTPTAWESATFTGVPDGIYSIQLTGSFSINWQPCDASISSGLSTFVVDTTPPTITNIPANITVYTPANSNKAVATWIAPSATDAIGVASFTSSIASGTAFALGVTTVTYTAKDAAGNTSTASFIVTVVDNVAPVISGMPANITLTPASGTTAVATWTSPTATDNVAVTAFTSNFSSGASFPFGVTTVTYKAVDAAGNQTVASFTVTVLDTVAPVIANCPANQTFQATGASGASASWTTPTATDNSGAATLTSTHPSGATFPIGSTTITYTARDATNNISTCAFIVIVQDTSAPVFASVPANIVVEAMSPAGASLSYAMPTASDVVSGSRPVAASRASGSIFPFTAPGPTTTTVTFSASDTASPANTSTASFTVTVRDTTAPVISTVPANITIEATGPTGATVSFAPVTVTDAADDAPVVTYSKVSGTTFPVGTTTVTVTAKDASSNLSSATFTVTVRDTIPPTLKSMPANVTAQATSAGGAAVTYAMPSATDLVTAPVTVTASKASGSMFPVGTTTVTFTAADAAGNVATGTFQVVVVDTSAPVFATLPADITVEATSPTGANVNYALPTATDAVDGARPVTASQPPNATFPLGTTTVTFTASDLATPPNIITATFNVTVRDTTPPAIGAPTNITIPASGPSGAIANIPAPAASDIADPAPTVILSPPSGSLFPIGVNIVTVTATDASGNTSTKTFTVTVSDSIAPVVSGCPANQTLHASAAPGAVATWTAPTASDNSGTASLIGSHASGATFPVGNTTVTYTAIDPAGNTATCSFTIIVQDTSAPVFAGVPANVVVEATSAAGAKVNYTLPTATDTVSGSRPVAASAAAGSMFPFSAPGPTTTTVTFSASDTATPVNTATASFTITVRDTTPPVITAVPANIAVEATGPAGAAVTYAPVAATDSVDPTPTVSYSRASGATFPVGTTTVTVTAKDASNNQSTATFTVTVRDTTPPALSSLPANITAQATTAAGAAVTFAMPTATDLVTAPITVTTSKPSGSQFPIGATMVAFTATDAAGNTATGTFQVTVIDQSAPVFAALPADITVEATSPAGTAVTYTLPTANDTVDGARPVTASQLPNAIFPLGTTTVTFIAADLASPPNTVTATFNVTVQDTTPPVIGALANITITATDPSGAVVTIPTPVTTDIADSNPTVALNPLSGSLFPIGVNTVTVTATDASGNKSTKIFTVNVLAQAQMAIDSGNGLNSTGPQGEQGAAFAPKSQAYVITNTGEAPMTFSLTGMPAWATATPATGTLSPSASMSVNLALSATANTLPVGTHNASIGFNNLSGGLGSTSRPITLTVTAPAALTVTPGTHFTAIGPQGGPFAPVSINYVLQNTGTSPLNYTASADQHSWLQVTPASGTLAAGATFTVVATITAGANALPPGSARSTVSFANTTNQVGSTTRAATLTVLQPARLNVDAADGLVSSGNPGGPFAPAAKTYKLTNTGEVPLTYSATRDATWFENTPPSGTIPAGGSVMVTVSLNTAAKALTGGQYAGAVTFSNTTNGFGSTSRPIALAVNANGQIILKVNSGDADGTFKFSSPTASLAMSLTTTAGSAQSSPVILAQGTYAVTASPPDGFGLTSIACSGTSVASLATRSATINVGTSEVVTCTFTSVNSRKKTTEVVRNFMGRRNDLLLSTGPDAGRQIDRLIEAGERTAEKPSQTDPAPSQDREAASGVGAPISRRGIGATTQASQALSAFLQRDSVRPEQAETWQPGAYSIAPATAAQNQDQEPARFAIAGSFSQMMRMSAEHEKRKIDAMQAPADTSPVTQRPLARSPYSPFDFWFQGHFAKFSERGAGQSDGYFGVLHTGIDYIFNPKLLLGLQGQFDSMKMRSSPNSYAINGQGWMAGPYTTVRLSENLFLQARVAAGVSTNIVSPFQTYSDTFTTRRWLASATLVGRWKLDNWVFQPSASVSYIDDASKAYVDSLGVTIPSVRSSLGQAKFGPEVSHRYVLPDGTIVEPRLGLQAIWNFTAAKTGADFGGTLAGPQELRGRVEAGVKFQGPSGSSLDVNVNYDGIGSRSYQAVGGKATVRIPLE